MEFYKKYVPVDVDDLVTLCNVPMASRPFNKRYRIRYTANVAEAGDMEFVNVPLDVFRKAAVAGHSDRTKMVAEFRTLRQAEFALAAVDVRVDGDAVSRLDIGDISADRSNDARIFVAKYDRRHRSGRSGRPSYRS